MVIKRSAKKFLSDVGAKRTTVKRRITVGTFNSADIEGRIREQAYLLYEKRGYTHGSDLDDWLEAEKIVTRS